MRLPALALTIAATLAAPLQAQQPFAWIYDAEFAIYPSDSHLNLVATRIGSEPESAEHDFPTGIIWGSCLAEFDSGEIFLRFDAFVSGVELGDLVSFSVTGDGDITINRDGLFVTPGTGPVGAIEIIVEAGGPEMALLASSDILTFGVTGQEDFHFTLENAANRAYVTVFDADCAALAAGGALQQSPQQLPDAPVSTSLTPDFGPEITGHVWTRFTQVSEDVFETVVSINYAVPETDDVFVIGQCYIGAQGPYVSLQVAADIDGMAENAAATLRVVSDDGRQVDVEGSVIGTAIEFGVSGIELILDMSDPAWLVIAGNRTVRFERVGSQGGFTLTGNGPSSIGPFLADCAEIDLLTPESGNRPSAPIGAQDGYLACDSLGRVGSQDTGQPTVLTFSNDTDAFRVLSWIDPTGAVIDQGAMNPGEQMTFTTDPGHFWMATDGPGNCRELIQPVAGQTEYLILVR